MTQRRVESVALYILEKVSSNGTSLRIRSTYLFNGTAALSKVSETFDCLLV